MRKLEGIERDLDRKFEVEVSFSSQLAELEDELEAIGDRLRLRLSDAGVSFLPIPQVQHEQLVTAAVHRRKPFNETGSGYRDALIWESVKESASQSLVPHIAFATKNTKDFAATDDNARLSSHLIAAFADSHPSGEIELVDLKRFVAAEFEKRLDVNEEIEGRLEHDEGFRQAFRDTLQRIDAELDEEMSITAAYSMALWDVQYQVRIDAGSFHLTGAAAIDDEQVFVVGEADVDIVFTAEVEASDYYDAEEDARPPEVEWESGQVLRVGDDFSVTGTRVEAVVDRRTGQVSSAVV